MRCVVPGFDGRYEVDEAGRVFSVDRIVVSTHPTQPRKSVKGRLLTQRTDHRGYLYVTLSIDGKSGSYRVHRIVMLALSPSSQSADLDVNHIDGDKTNNSIGNLEWATRAENIKHSFQHLGRRSSTLGKFGASHHNSIPIVGQCKKSMGVKVQFASMADAERSGFLASKISQCLSGKRRSHKGFLWSRVSGTENNSLTDE